MFNYYKRIAELSREYEIDGRHEKSLNLKYILFKSNRCSICGGCLDTDEEKNMSSCLNCNNNK